MDFSIFACLIASFVNLTPLPALARDRTGGSEAKTQDLNRRLEEVEGTHLRFNKELQERAERERQEHHNQADQAGKKEQDAESLKRGGLTGSANQRAYERGYQKKTMEIRQQKDEEIMRGVQARKAARQQSEAARKAKAFTPQQKKDMLRHVNRVK